MRSPVSVTIGISLLVGGAPLVAQDHAPAPAASRATAQPAPAKDVQVTPALPPAKVAAAVAEALRAAEAAQARRTTRAPARTDSPPPAPASGAHSRRYAVRWPEQRMVVQWPGAAKTDRVVLTWPDSF